MLLHVPAIRRLRRRNGTPSSRRASRQQSAAVCGACIFRRANPTRSTVWRLNRNSTSR